MISLPAGSRIWLVAGITDMRNGFNGLASKVQNVLKDDPFSGHLFIFRGRRGDQIGEPAEFGKNRTLRFSGHP